MTETTQGAGLVISSFPWVDAVSRFAVTIAAHAHLHHPPRDARLSQRFDHSGGSRRSKGPRAAYGQGEAGPDLCFAIGSRDRDGAIHRRADGIAHDDRALDAGDSQLLAGAPAVRPADDVGL